MPEERGFSTMKLSCWPTCGVGSLFGVGAHSGAEMERRARRGSPVELARAPAVRERPAAPAGAELLLRVPAPGGCRRGCVLKTPPAWGWSVSPRGVDARTRGADEGR